MYKPVRRLRKTVLLFLNADKSYFTGSMRSISLSPPINAASRSQRQPSDRTDAEVARMQRLARSKQCSRAGSRTARKRRSRLSPVRHLANPACLIGIPKLEAAHAGSRITFGCSDLTALAQSLVEFG